MKVRFTGATCYKIMKMQYRFTTFITIIGHANIKTQGKTEKKKQNQKILKTKQQTSKRTNNLTASKGKNR